MWLITGAGGQLGSILTRQLLASGHEVCAVTSSNGPRPVGCHCVALDLDDFDRAARLIRKVNPRYIIHTAAVTSVMVAYQHPERARRINIDATQHLAQAAEEVGARFAFTSTDLVFDGSAAPYHEMSVAHPCSIYGKSKLQAEARMKDVGSTAIVRLPLMIGLPAVHRATTFCDQVSALLNQQPLKLFEDEFRTPIGFEDAARACRQIAESDFTGIIHAGGPERVSRLRIGESLADALKVSKTNIVPTRQSDLQFPEPRPTDVSLDSSLFEKAFGRPAGRSVADVMREVAKRVRDGA